MIVRRCHDIAKAWFFVTSRTAMLADSKLRTTNTACHAICITPAFGLSALHSSAYAAISFQPAFVGFHPLGLAR